MAFAHDIRTAETGFNFSGMIARFFDTMQRRRVYRETVRELSNLTTRELEDLGLSRSMITRVALEAAYGK